MDMFFERHVLSPLSVYFVKLEREVGEALLRGAVPVKDVARLSSTLAYMETFFNDNERDSLREAEHFLSDVFVQLRAEARFLSPRDGVVERANAFFKEHLSESITLTEVAQAVGVSVSTLIARFKKEMGVTPLSALIDLRLNHARYLLSTKRGTLEEIALACGFDNAFYFSNVFQKKVGMRPSLYREKHLI